MYIHARTHIMYPFFIEAASRFSILPRLNRGEGERERVSECEKESVRLGGRVYVYERGRERERMKKMETRSRGCCSR